MSGLTAIGPIAGFAGPTHERGRMATPPGIDDPLALRHVARMLRIDDIFYSIQGRPLFEAASATIPEGHKVGLVGPNGAGKTTLFRLLRGEIAPDGGEIALPSRARIGGVAQEAPGTALPVLQTVLAEDRERSALLAEADRATDAHRIAEIQTNIEPDRKKKRDQDKSVLVSKIFDNRDFGYLKITVERPLRLLSLIPVSDVVENGSAEGEAVAAETSLRDALAICLWTGREALPVTSEGPVPQRITLDAIRARAEGRT